MTRRLNKLQAAFVIARRDYAATVFSRAFLFFLLGPLFPVLLGVLFGSIGAKVASEAERTRVAVVASPADFGRMQKAWNELVPLSGVATFPQLSQAPPGQSPPALLRSPANLVTAVLTDPFGSPALIGKIGPDDPLVGQMRLILDRARNHAGPMATLRVDQVRQTAGATRNAAR
jgi:ABC-2 type transport system permease protein